MKIKLEKLNVILNTLIPSEFLLFADDYERQANTNPFLLKHLHQRIRKVPFGNNQDEKKSKEFFQKHAQFFEVIDNLELEEKRLFESHLKTLHILYTDLQNDNLQNFKQEIQTLENMKVDTISFGFTIQKRKPAPTLSTTGLKTFIKNDSKNIEKLFVFSDGNIVKPKLYMERKNEDKIVGCMFDLQNANFILESKTINDLPKNHLSISGLNINAKAIEPFIELDKNDFNENIVKTLDQVCLSDRDYEITIDYPEAKDKTPKQLYR